MNKINEKRKDYLRKYHKEYAKKPEVRVHRKIYYKNYYRTHKEKYIAALKKYGQTEKGKAYQARARIKWRDYYIQYHRKRRQEAKRKKAAGNQPSLKS